MGGSRYVFLGVLFAAELAHAQDAKPKTAVMPLQPKRVDAVTAEMLDDMLARAIEGSGCCQVMSVQDVNAMLGFEKARDAVGCDDLTCAVDLGGALGVDYFVAGSVGRLGGEFLVQLKLFNVIQSKVVGRGDSTVQDDEKLYRRAIEMAVASMLGVKTPQSPAASPGAGSVAKLPRLRFYARDASYLFDVEFTAG
ncbi:MAG: hypothetical protein HYZ27_01275, partial [Deltaproteobacteria bacterium]|nr:hypothetical protein [Deltaproteobacteria bacterium]